MAVRFTVGRATVRPLPVISFKWDDVFDNNNDILKFFNTARNAVNPTTIAAFIAKRIHSAGMDGDTMRAAALDADNFLTKLADDVSALGPNFNDAANTIRRDAKVALVPFLN